MNCITFNTILGIFFSVKFLFFYFFLFIFSFSQAQVTHSLYAQFPSHHHKLYQFVWNWKKARNEIPQTFVLCPILPHKIPWYQYRYVWVNTVVWADILLTTDLFYTYRYWYHYPGISKQYTDITISKYLPKTHSSYNNELFSAIQFKLFSNHIQHTFLFFLMQMRNKIGRI